MNYNLQQFWSAAAEMTFADLRSVAAALLDLAQDRETDFASIPEIMELLADVGASKMEMEAERKAKEKQGAQS